MLRSHLVEQIFLILTLFNCLVNTIKNADKIIAPMNRSDYFVETVTRGWGGPRATLIK